MVTIRPEGVSESLQLGPDLDGGQRPQAVVPSGVWQGARPMGGAYSLVGCTVSLGFAFADFEMHSREQLLKLFPRHADLLEHFTR